MPRGAPGTHRPPSWLHSPPWCGPPPLWFGLQDPRPALGHGQSCPSHGSVWSRGGASQTDPAAWRPILQPAGAMGSAARSGERVGGVLGGSRSAGSFHGVHIGSGAVNLGSAQSWDAKQESYFGQVGQVTGLNRLPRKGLVNTVEITWDAGCVSVWRSRAGSHPEMTALPRWRLGSEASGCRPGGSARWLLLPTVLVLLPPPLYVMQLLQTSSFNPDVCILNKRPFLVPCLYSASV